jgi:quercetin dioxygenase-like cupin family protein
MEELTNSRHGAEHRRAFVVGVISLAAVGALVLLVAGIGVPASAADHGAPHVEPLTRNSFVDDVAVQVQVRTDTLTVERSLEDASDVVVARITIGPGVVAPWHTHHGPAFLLNTGPGTLTSVLADDCQPRDYPAGAAFLDPGSGSLHAAVNNGAEEVVLYAIFLGVSNGPVIPAEPPTDCEV